MTTDKTIPLLFAAVLLLALAACRPTPACVDFEPPLSIGTVYGTPVGQVPGDLAFTSSGIPITVWDFVFTGGGGTFNQAEIVTPPVAFGSGQVINTNNINLEFDFSSLSFQPQQVDLKFLDLGGFENLVVNGSPSPVYAGEFSAAPSPLGGVTVAVATTPVSGGQEGTMTLTGAVTTLRVGGQEFWLDDVCARP